MSSSLHIPHSLQENVRMDIGRRATLKEEGGRRGLQEVNPNLPRDDGKGIHPNLRRQHAGRLASKSESTFSIFCDESVGSGKKDKSRRNAAEYREDKENIVPHIHRAKHGGLRVQSSVNSNLQMEEKSQPASAKECVDSPMVVEEKEQWRVPPIKDNKTVDIFTEPEYFQDIYNYLKESESKHLPKWNYMAKQTDITHSMRSILVDWLVEVSEEYKLQTETLHLAVNYIDRFLSYMAVQRSKLQLVGAACMFIAAKYEEIYPPDVSEFVYITDDTYNKRQVLRMEHLVLKVLGFDLSVPTTYLFLNKIVEMAPLSKAVKDNVSSLAAYLSELSLVDGDSFLKYTPSQVAAASVALARHTFEEDAWAPELQERTGYSLEELKSCILSLHECMIKAEENPQQAVRDKYKVSKHCCVSQISPPTIF